MEDIGFMSKRKSVMRFLLTFLILCRPDLFLVSATLDQKLICYRTTSCNTDAEDMRAAINLIPSSPPPPIPEDPSSSAQPQTSINPDTYRVPAIFETSPLGQIYIRVITASGLELDGATRMTHLWPQARKAALTLYGKCRMGESGSSARALSTTTWSGPPWRQLDFIIDMACNINKLSLPEGTGIATYTPLGVESGKRIGAGSSFVQLAGGQYKD